MRKGIYYERIRDAATKALQRLATLAGDTDLPEESVKYTAGMCAIEFRILAVLIDEARIQPGECVFPSPYELLGE